MTKDELQNALQEKNWHAIWIAAIHGALSFPLIEMLLSSSEVPDWLRNVFNTVASPESDG